MKNPIGTLFCIIDATPTKNKKSYWKITGEPMRNGSYPVIASDKYGNSKSKKNGFNQRWIDSLDTQEYFESHTDSICARIANSGRFGYIVGVFDINKKTDMSSADMKNYKKVRRIKFLQNKIEAYKIEISKLQTEIEEENNK